MICRIQIFCLNWKRKRALWWNDDSRMEKVERAREREKKQPKINVYQLSDYRCTCAMKAALPSKYNHIFIICMHLTNRWRRKREENWFNLKWREQIKRQIAVNPRHERTQSNRKNEMTEHMHRERKIHASQVATSFFFSSSKFRLIGMRTRL